MSIEERINLVKRNTVEIVNENKIKDFLKKGVVYCGYECSGEIHLGHLVTIIKLLDLQKAGIKVKVLLADWHTWLNQKGDWDFVNKQVKQWGKGMKSIGLKADIVGDFTNLPREIKNRKFKLIVWDVPHFRKRKLTGAFLKKFGGLIPETWQSDLKEGFNELWYVLEDYGVLLFKFSDNHIKFKDVLNLFPKKPLFFNAFSSKGPSETKWFCFMKIPK